MVPCPTTTDLFPRSLMSHQTRLLSLTFFMQLPQLNSERLRILLIESLPLRGTIIGNGRNSSGDGDGDGRDFVGFPSLYLFGIKKKNDQEAYFLLWWNVDRTTTFLILFFWVMFG